MPLKAATRQQDPNLRKIKLDQKFKKAYSLKSWLSRKGWSGGEKEGDRVGVDLAGGLIL